MTEIKINDILGIDNNAQYYVHLSCWNKLEQPLDVFLNNEDNYKKWQEWKGNIKNGKIVKEKFPKRDYVISFAQIYHEGSDIHLFTGIYQITKRLDHKYEVKKTENFQNLVGRLKIKHKRRGQASAFLFENIANKMFVFELLQERMECRIFQGYNKINLKFTELETIVKKDVKEWRLKLDNLQGIYLLIDDSNNKFYVGCAYGKLGIWQRWRDYIHNYTGGNKDLDKLYQKVGENHFKKNFRFVLLEYFTDKTEQNYIIERESFWKNALDTRKFGYNNN